MVWRPFKYGSVAIQSAPKYAYIAFMSVVFAIEDIFFRNCHTWHLFEVVGAQRSTAAASQGVRAHTTLTGKARHFSPTFQRGIRWIIIFCIPREFSYHHGEEGKTPEGQESQPVAGEAKISSSNEWSSLPCHRRHHHHHARRGDQVPKYGTKQL